MRALSQRVSRLVVNMVAEHGCPRDRGVWPLQEQILEKICEQIADVNVPQVVEQIIEVHKMAEQILDVLVPEMVEQLVECRRPFSWKEPSSGLWNRSSTLESRRLWKKLQRFSGFSPRTGLKSALWSRSFLLFHSLRRSLWWPVSQMQGTTQRGVNTHAQHVVNAVEVEKPKIIELTVQRKKFIIQEKINQVTKHVKIPELQFTDKVVDNPVVVQGQISMETVQKSIEISQLQNCDEVVDVPAVFVEQVPHVHVEMKTVEITQLQPVEQVPRVLVVEKTTEIHSFKLLIRWSMSLLSRCRARSTGECRGEDSSDPTVAVPRENRRDPENPDDPGPSDL